VTPDEALGPLVHAMGGAARRLRLEDVRASAPQVLEVSFGDLREKWEVEDVAGLVHNLNDLFRDEADVRLVCVLGEWEDMLQTWALPRDALRVLLEGRELDGASNAAMLRRLLEPREPGW
jgi:ethanolamine utilization protein EutQ (cupin superfamily)